MASQAPQQPPQSPEFVTYDAACRMTGATPKTVRAAVKEGRIRAYKYGYRTVRLVREDVVAFMEAARLPGFNGGERR